ncbi:hypothetical protein SSS_02974 [Sarcoptes scabiei]|nr:hypothetical protein SSS_02974 [Sarcoptes scabiei]
MPKFDCDVNSFQIEVAYRLMTNSLEKFCIKIPRSNPEYFHDELYPPTYFLATPLISGFQFSLMLLYQNKGKQLKKIDLPQIPRISLQPKDKIAFSSIREELFEERRMEQKIRLSKLNNEYPTDFQSDTTGPPRSRIETIMGDALDLILNGIQDDEPETDSEESNSSEWDS